MDQDTLKKILLDHQRWLNGEPYPKGVRADLFGANLSKADLSGVNLSGANLFGANLSKADLSGANLSKADLSGANLSKADLSKADLSGANLSKADLSKANLSKANLSGADLYGADLYGADLSGADLPRANLFGANLSRADLYGADLSRADLYGADLSRANLSRANLYGADLSEANLSGANLSEAKKIPTEVYENTLICPQEGSFTAWKKLRNGRIAKLTIPADAKRHNATGRKCRASSAIVEAIFDGESNVLVGYSQHDPSFEYRVGNTVHPSESFDDNRWNECGSGIHFFITRGEAERY
jgi:uncharacterized protein YjbI with pentapeptide repeats